MGSCIYFSRLTVDEESAMFAHRRDVLERMLAEVAHVTRFETIRSAFAEQIERDPFDLTAAYSPPNGTMINRLQQMALFLAIAFYCEEMLRVKPSCISFYSSGVQPALVYAGCVSLSDYFSYILPLVGDNRRRLEEAGRIHSLAECLLAGSEGEDVEACTRQAILDLRLTGRVFIKDVRDRHAVLIAGFRGEVMEVRSAVSDSFTSVAARERHVHHTDGAHIPLYERTSFESLMRLTRISPPRIPMVGTSGEFLPVNSNTARTISVLADAVGGPMVTHHALREIRKLSSSMLFVGSELGVKVVQAPNKRSDETSRDMPVELAIDVIKESLRTHGSA